MNMGGIDNFINMFVSGASKSATQASGVPQAVDELTRKVEQKLDVAETAGVTYVGASLFLQFVSTIAVVVIAKTAWDRAKKG